MDAAAVDLAWAAGFIDGEGCITVPVRMRVRNRRDYSLSLYVGQVDPRPLHRLRGMFGGSVVAKGKQEHGRRAMYMWRLTGTTAERCLRAILPYLVVKKDQADLALALRDRITSYVQVGRRVDDTETAARLSLVTAIKDAKWRTYGEEVMPECPKR